MTYASTEVDFGIERKELKIGATVLAFKIEETIEIATFLMVSKFEDAEIFIEIGIFVMMLGTMEGTEVPHYEIMNLEIEKIVEAIAEIGILLVERSCRQTTNAGRSKCQLDGSLTHLHCMFRVFSSRYQTAPTKMFFFLSRSLSEGAALGVKEPTEERYSGGESLSEASFVRSPKPTNVYSTIMSQKKKWTGKRASQQQLVAKFKYDEDKVLPSRPDIGTLGRKVMVEVNCWDFEVADVQIYRYDIQPEELLSVTETGSRVLRSGERRLRSFMKFVDEAMGDDVFSDGRRFYYSLEPLEEKFDLSKSQLMAIPDDERADLRLKYVIKKVGTISSERIKQYLSNPRSKTSELPQDAINMLDNLFRWVNRKAYEIFKTGVFQSNPIRGVERTSGLYSIYKGYSFSVRPQWKLRVNVDLSYKATFPAGNLAEILYSKYGEGMYNKAVWPRIAAEITSIRAEASHYKNAATGKSYSRRFVMYDLSGETAQNIIIKEKNMSVEEYFKEQYGIALRYPDLPCVRTKRDKDEFMPIELLNVLPFQRAKEDRGLIAADVVRVAAVVPSERFRELRGFIRHFIAMRSSLISKVKLKLSDPEPVRVEARELPQPLARFFGGPKELKRGSWNQEPFFKAASTFLKWVIVVLPPFRVRNVEIVLRELPRAARNLGLVMDRNAEVLRATSPDLPVLFENLSRKGVQLAVCILSDSKAYAEIKRASELTKFMVTQCVKDSSLSKRKVMENLLLKINGKLGGLNWLLTGLSEKWGQEAPMVVGADVTHPDQTGGHGELKKSVAAVVASISLDLMRYVAVVRQQESKVGKETNAAREYIDEMEDMFTDLLKAFGRHNNDRLPTKIIIYRDGVSEGQFYPVLMSELASIQRACIGIRPDYEPGITFIVVQKRHHIRFNPIGGGKSDNVNAGTVVDTEITHKREFDFYLCSHQGIQGTSKPAHYNVLYDDNDWHADDLQLFTYFLCHAYMRCNRSVSYPAPTYYAHLAAFRARDWLRDAPDSSALLRNNKFTVVAEQQDLMFFL
ncbi:hypothetical protein Aperf_G00000131371 [Anoplocephala perfoliata]